MSDRKNLHAIIKEAKKTLKLANSKNVESHPKIERQIMRVKGNIRHIRVEVHRLPKRVTA